MYMCMFYKAVHMHALFTGYVCVLHVHVLQDRADALFKQVNDTKQMKGRSNEAVAAACLYIACRKESVPRTLKGQRSTVLNEYFMYFLQSVVYV